MQSVVQQASALVSPLGDAAFALFSLLPGASRLAGLTAAQSIPLALLLAYVPHWIRTFAYVRPKLGDAFDLRYVRDSVAKASDDSAAGRAVARLSGAHANGLEAFAAFAAAVLLALATRAMPAARLDAAARTWLALRVVYTALYAGGTRRWHAAARSIVWVASAAVIGQIMYAAAFGAPARASSLW